jgi:tetratricopeptide (TPR) repeat protein
MTQYNLANALSELGTRSDGEEGRKLLAEAAAAYRSALEVYTKANLPQRRAMTQYNLGNALRELGTRSGGEEGRKLLAEAVAACRSALEVYTKADLPQDWAQTQIALGDALEALGNQLKGEEALKRKREVVELLRDLMSYQSDDLSHYRLASALGDFAFQLDPKKSSHGVHVVTDFCYYEFVPSANGSWNRGTTVSNAEGAEVSG